MVCFCIDTICIEILYFGKTFVQQPLFGKQKEAWVTGKVVVKIDKKLAIPWQKTHLVALPGNDHGTLEEGVSVLIQDSEREEDSVGCF